VALILIVEDEKLLRWALTEQLTRVGHTVHAAADLAEAREHLGKHQPDVMLLDLSLPDGHGLDFYQKHERQLEDSVVIVMTAVGQVEDAVRAMKLGALDFLNKPVDQAELVELVSRSLNLRSDQLEAQAARQSRERHLRQDLVAESPVFREILRVAEEVAKSEVSSILLLGESGSGKNVLAREIHAHSSRKDKPAIEVPCAAIPDQLLESELLGHERGAFTDAKSTRKGAFELADGGTVVLDEIGELKLELQAKLLHVLEERRLRRVGGSREILVDVRVIALTNRDLKAMVQDGSFRRDLFYRLNIFPIQVPPLREHPEDILPLARHFLDQLQAKFGRKFEGFDREAENRLLGYSWPGNVRELRNVIERAMVLDPGPLIQPGSLILDQLSAPAASGDEAEDDAGIVPLEEMERRLVERAMQAAGNNQTRAAQLLGVSRDQLRYRLKKFEM
jgi:DNA-binding NtrC family response regulator